MNKRKFRPIAFILTLLMMFTIYTPIGGAVYAVGVAPSLINGLGGDAGFGENNLVVDDDIYKEVDITSVFPDGIRFGASTYGAININTNGVIHFGIDTENYAAFDPTGITDSLDPLIAGFWSDIDTAASNGGMTSGGNSTGSNKVYYDLDTANHIVTITWDDVAPFQDVDPNLKSNAFQIRISNLGTENVGVEIRYEAIEWSDGAVMGWATGDGGPSYEIPGSGIDESVLVFPTTDLGGSVPGIYSTSIRGGSVGVTDSVSTTVNQTIAFVSSGSSISNLVVVDSGVTASAVETTFEAIVSVEPDGGEGSKDGDALTVSSGALSYYGLTASGQGTASLTITGSSTYISDILQEVQFRTTSGAFENRIVTFSISSGGASPVTATKEIAFFDHFDVTCENPVLQMDDMTVNVQAIGKDNHNNIDYPGKFVLGSSDESGFYGVSPQDTRDLEVFPKTPYDLSSKGAITLTLQAIMANNYWVSATGSSETYYKTDYYNDLVVYDIEMTPVNPTIVAGDYQTVTLTREDANGVAVTKGAITLVLSDDLDSGIHNFYSSGEGSTTIRAITLASGNSQATFKFYSEKAAYPVTITAEKAISDGDGGYYVLDGRYTTNDAITVSHAAIASFAISTSETGIYGDDKDVYVRARDIYDNTVLNYVGTIAFTIIDNGKTERNISNQTFSISDQGDKLFTNAIRFGRVGTDRWVRVTATNNSSILGKQEGIEVTQKGVTVTSIAVTTKIYDGTTTAAVTATLTGIVTGPLTNSTIDDDSLILNISNTGFSHRHVVAAKTVVSTFTISDGPNPEGDSHDNYDILDESANYYIINPSVTTGGTITVKTVTGSATAGSTKTYDGTIAATVSRALTGIVTPDIGYISLTGTATYDNKNVGTEKVVTINTPSLTSSSPEVYLVSDYSLSAASAITTSAIITKLDVSGSFTASNKTYDGTTAASIATQTLTGKVSGDTASLTGTAEFSSKEIGTWDVTLNIPSITGTDSGNYRLVTTGAITTSAIISAASAGGGGLGGGGGAVVVEPPVVTPPATTAKLKLEFNIGINNSYLTTGTTVKAIQVMDIAPVIMENRTLLPIRFVVEPLGGTIAWNEPEQKVTIIRGTTTIELWIGNNMASINGVLVMIDPSNPNVKPFIIDPPGRTMLPLRFISEALGCTVEWDEPLQLVTITEL